MLRFAGMILVMGTSLWFGAYFAMKEKYRLRELEELERGLIYLQGQIGYLSAPLSEAFGGIGWKAEGQVGEVFRQAAEKLQERQGASAEEIWKACWEKEIPRLFLTAEDIEEVFAFGKSLGYLDKTQQENSISLLRSYIADALAKGRKRLEKNGRLYYGVSGLSGLLVVVTLL